MARITTRIAKVTPLTDFTCEICGIVAEVRQQVDRGSFGLYPYANLVVGESDNIHLDAPWSDPTYWAGILMARHQIDEHQRGKFISPPR